MTKRCALYARVSTKRHGQNTETQLVPLREYARNRGLTITEEYVDHGVSGSTADRPQLARLMDAARRREYDVVLVARFDRFARSTMHLATALAEFQAMGIDFTSLNESVDTSTPMGKMVFTVLGAVAELERDIIRERVRAGVALARKKHEHWGRPVKIFDRQKALRLHREGKSTREIAKAVGVGKDTVAALVREAS